ncbi:50S ribosomal protein L11 methyltransferase [Sphingomonas morindae]|uniref:Ribosomal protein L11 methyltransferase n=1 Tax=Sphingomonas morindae TaxID=1541170 RepID=A0ABY4X8R3_9SPHN|nr:50S ribosomal protein L11 methyltransferase [Sphingomonas morindae]USI73336.1 50S ribosomal protein L11 methyltransferase [Sphingomonas morindae]
MSAEATSWKIVLPCTRAEAEALALATDPFPDLDTPPVLNTLEPDETQPEAWLLEAYVEGEPDAATIAAVRALVASTEAPRVEPVPDQDWVTLSQAGLEPIHAGRFFVHTAAHADVAPPPGAVPFLIDAGQAFGTGHHYTTAGCLEVLDGLKRAGRRFEAIADVGTGTGLLAFAALALWPRARALATDIDPVSVRVTLDNAEANGVRIGGGRGALVVAEAEGVAHPLYDAFGPFDLVIANILAQPLIELAPSIGAVVAPGGTLLLAGLLDSQADAVAAAYRRRGFRLAASHQRGDWPVLTLRKRRTWLRD